MKFEDLKEGDAVSGADLFEVTEGAGLVEAANARVIVPKKGGLIREMKLPSGKVVEAMKVSIIRPCISRGKKLGGLSPIYTPEMLEANAGVFTGWPMYQDHLMEAAVEELEEELIEMGGTDLYGFLQERARRIKELGGRVVESWWEDDITFEDDADFDFQKGGVVGAVIPQPGIRKMLEADPEILNVSINAYPTGGKAAKVPWNEKLRGLMIEGIRRTPMGSVDWVFRGGAGGRPLIEEDAAERKRTVAVLEAAYDFDHDESDRTSEGDRQVKKKLSEMTRDELVEHLREEGAEHLVPAVEAESGGSGSGDDKPLTRAEAGRMIREGVENALGAVTEQIGQIKESAKDSATEAIAEERENRALAEAASSLIATAVKGGLSGKFAESLAEEFGVAEDGEPGPGLMVEAEEGENGKSRKELVEAAVKSRIETFIEALRESGGEPVVEGFGGESTPTEKKTDRKGSAFRDSLRESGDLDDPEKEDDTVAEMVRGGF